MKFEKSFTEYFQSKRNRFDIAMFDIDGTLAIGAEVLPGAAELVQNLKAESFPFALLTNDGTRSPRQKAALLTSMGIPVDESDIVSCAEAIGSYVEQKGYSGYKVFIMGELGRPCYAHRAQLTPTRKLSELSDCDGVIVGEANYDWESTFNAVINFFVNKSGAFLIVPNPDTYWPTERAEINIGAGGKARFIETVLKEYGIFIEPIYLGKPSPAIFRHALNHLGSLYRLTSKSLPSRILHVGDSLTSDVQGANNMRFTSGLVLTGITRKEHITNLNRSPSEHHPDLVFEGL